MITSLNNFRGIQLESDIAVITLDDNLTHTYFSKLEWEKDNSMPIGIAKLTMPYDPQYEQYWSTYYGGVVIHANLNDKPKWTQNEVATMQQAPTAEIKKDKTDDKKIRLQNDEYNYSFIGKVHRHKQVGKNVIIYLEDLGWKFLQKVPDDFRKTYIAGQTLDNAFQAICEFMGVEFAYSIEDLSKYNFSTDGYSIEKDGSVIEDVPTIFEEFKNDSEEPEEEMTEEERMGQQIQEGEPFEAPGLVEYTQQQQANQQASNQANNQASNQALNQTVTNSSNNQTNTEIEENNPKTEEFQEEFDRKIEDLFKGNTLYTSNISDPILNYNWITVQPTAQTSANTSTTNSTQPDANTNAQENNNTESNDTNNNTNTNEV